MEVPELPYRTEYAKSGRAGCRGCKEPIEKDSLRLAVMVQSSFFDGKQPNWYHFDCFFRKFKPKDVSEIAHFEFLRWKDQESIREKLQNSGNLSCSTASTNSKVSKSKKRNHAESNGVPDLGDYTVEYAKSKRSKCKVCEEFINKDEVRISKKDYENETALKYGPTERWHHIDCFIKAREELGFFASGEILPGFQNLSPEDQTMLKSKIPKITKNDTTDAPSPSKRSKEDKLIQSKLKKQSEEMFKFRDKLKDLTKQELSSLFEYNNQDVPEGIPRMLDRLCDAMTFGALKRCEKCKGQLTFRSGIGYQCLGYISEWCKCDAFYPEPTRTDFKIPEDLMEKYLFLKKYKSRVSNRFFLKSLTPAKSSETQPPKRSKSVLDSLNFFIHKTQSKTFEDLKKQVENLGGAVVKKFEKTVVAVISVNAEVQKNKLSKNLELAKELDILILPENFFDDITASTSEEELIRKLNSNKISSWGADPSSKIKGRVTPVKKSVYPEKSVYPKKSENFKSNETSKKVTLKDGLAVDPDSKLEKIAHVYRRGDEIFSTVMSLTDVQTKKNSYYRMQILESDKKQKYWLFRAWGRIGTTIGGNKVEEYDTLNDCIEIFKEFFEEKTGNTWEMRNSFEKVPGKMMIMDVQYKETAEASKPKAKIESKTLPKSVQDLITLIFDIESMKKAMLEFELDLHKMPLGKISQKQIQKAFGILSELQNLIDSTAEKHLFVEKTNMFYTLIPHDCGINVPPLLDNEELIKQKVDILNSLMDIEIAYRILQESEKLENSIDDYYKQLNTEITDLDPDSEEFKFIQLYVKNTHAKTHMNYALEIQNVFKIERKGEAKRYKKFSKLPNRKLLWHGSRITNFAGILSQGLRIAPPEAPTTGFMFGKGIYFADMVSKSANYCNTSKKNPTGLLLLCEVALGEMHELTKADYIKKLPPGKQSVKGVGKTQPDPAEKMISPTGAEVPLGKSVDTKIKDSSLLYNEYIVYNVAQVKIQYLLKLNFKHKI